MSTVQFEIRALIKTPKGNRMEVMETFPDESAERISRCWFNEMKVLHPETYFERIKVEHSETCLDFTEGR